MDDAAQMLLAIAGQLERAQELSNVAEELSGELVTLTGMGRSDEDGATVTVDHQGIVIDVVFSDAIRDADGPTVSEWVMSATTRAIEDLQKQAEPIRAAILQPHLVAPAVDFSARIDELFERVQRLDAETSAATPVKDEFEGGSR